jgi:uncharacterized protein (TIGR03118 family)
MKHLGRSLVPVALVATCLVAASGARGQALGTSPAPLFPSSLTNNYTVTPLVSNLPGKAPVMDGNLQNPWGVAFTPAGSPFWIADNNSGLSTLYDGNGTIVPLVVTIPCPSSAGQGSSCPTTASPTGIVWNPSTTGFLVPGTSLPASFIFDSEDGTISAWTGNLTPANRAVLAVNNSTTPSAALGAVYKGLVVGVNVNGLFLFATNFRAGTIDVFDTKFNQVMPGTVGKIDGNFADPNIPPSFAPFGIQSINGDLFVTYAMQNGPKHDDVAGVGHGYVDIFDTDGHLLRRFASAGTLNSPWGVARASSTFGLYSGKILIGNFGDGKINVYKNDGTFVDQLRGTNPLIPLSIDGLWTLTLGGGAKSSPDTLYFTAGPNNETNGLFGTIAPTAPSLITP